MKELVYIAVGVVFGFVIGYLLGVVQERDFRHIVFERDKYGRITAIHKVA